jgi:CheY-like chemotaxis protein
MTESAATNTGRFTFLLAERDLGNVAKFKSLLSNTGAELIIARAPYQAVKLYRARVRAGQKTDLIFIGVGEPLKKGTTYDLRNTEGLQVTREIREYEQFAQVDRTPVIAITNPVHALEETVYTSSGVSDFLYSPVTDVLLARSLKIWAPDLN